MIKTKLNIYTKTNQLIGVLFEGSKISRIFFIIKGFKIEEYRVETDPTSVDLSLNHVWIRGWSGFFIYVCAYRLFHNSTAKSQTSVEMKAFTEIALLYLEQLTHSILLRFMLKTY